MKRVLYQSIGIIHSPFEDIAGMPIQTTGASGIPGTVTVYARFASALKDLDGFSHIILLYHFHRCRGFSVEVRPFLDQTTRGVFATRVPRRPNRIGISVVRLVKRKRNVLYIKDVDIVEGTPLLDIKPYVPEFDSRKTERIGWLAGKVQNVRGTRSDDRFR